VADLKKQGESGRKRKDVLTRTLAVVVASAQAIGVMAYLRSGAGIEGSPDLLPNLGFWGEVHTVATLVAGFLLLTWLAEAITRYGLGSGMSILILVSLIAGLPGQGLDVLAVAGAGAFVALLVVAMLGIVAVVAFTLAERRLEVTQSRGASRKRATSPVLPLKVAQAGVVPVIFTTAILTLLTSLAGLLPARGFGGEVRVVLEGNLVNSGSWVYMLVFAALTMFFTYFYTAVTFNPLEVADDMKRHGSFLPGIRPGAETSTRLAWVVARLAVGGGVLITLVALLPSFAQNVFGIAQFPLGGVAVLIAVGAVLDTMKQIKVRALLYDYDRLVEGEETAELRAA
jgi:preprotein translocase subunit SecY